MPAKERGHKEVTETLTQAEAKENSIVPGKASLGCAVLKGLP